MEPPDTKPPRQNTFKFTCQSQDYETFNILFSSEFDSGNLLDVQYQGSASFILNTAPDCYGTEHEGFTRSWFYFSVNGAPCGVKLTFLVKKIHILWSLFKNAPNTYRPVYKIDDGRWNRLDEPAKLIFEQEANSLDVEFGYISPGNDKTIYFAFSYPFSYSECQNKIQRLFDTYAKDNEIYFHREILIKSPQNRNIDLLTITSYDGKMNERESLFNDFVFPARDIIPRAHKFRSNKPVILITARVHPGETPASHTMNGVLDFIVDKRDIRASLLRKYFVFMIVPMINPDGVALGHFRMDVYHQNLNRHYKDPDKDKQPMIFGIKELVTYLNNEKRLFFYCDLHAHAAKKGSFLYGNALDFVMQVESMLFAKVMSLNCINFEYDSCNFSKRQMNSRDKGEKLTKEGAGRVCIYKLCDIIHSYTLECGFHYSNTLSFINKPIIPKVLPRNMGCYETNITNNQADMYQSQPVYYTIEIYEDVGKAMLVSILDIFNKNPCSRIPNQGLEHIRKDIAAKAAKQARFKKDANTRKKCYKINQLAQEVFYEEFEKKNVFVQPRAPYIRKTQQQSDPNKPPEYTTPTYSSKAKTLIFKQSQQTIIEPPIADSLSEEDSDSSSEERSLSKYGGKNKGKNSNLVLPPNEFVTQFFDDIKEDYKLSYKPNDAYFLTPLPLKTIKSGERLLPTSPELNSLKEDGKMSIENFLKNKSAMSSYDLYPIGSSYKPRIPAIPSKNFLHERKVKSNTIKLPDLRRSNTGGESMFNSIFLVIGGKNLNTAKILPNFQYTPNKKKWINAPDEKI